MSNNDKEKLLPNDQNSTTVWKQSKLGLFQFVTATTVIVLSYIQYYALIASLSLTWTFPKSYTQATYWLFLFNLDIWEFAKIFGGEYKAYRDYATPSNLVLGDKFVVWYAIFAIIHWGTYVLASILYFIFTRNAKLKEQYVPRLRIGLVIFWYLMCIPAGVNYTKVYWCLPKGGAMDVANDYTCWASAESKAYFIISFISLLFHFVIIPLFYFNRIRKALVTPYIRAHENYLLRRELETEFNLNSKFLTESLYYYSLFRRTRAYMLVSDIFFRGGLVLAYGAFFSLSNNENEQLGSYGKLISAIIIFALILLKFFNDLFRLPFRPFVLNALNLICLIFLFMNSVFGLMLNVPNLETAFQSPTYLKPLLIFVNSSWLFAILFWIAYIVWKAHYRRIWPSLYSKQRRNYLSGQNDRFVTALEEASLVIAETRKVVPLFAPAHKLKFQILKINALTREAEYYNELLHPTLQECLQILTELYAQIRSSSVFSGNASNLNQNQIAEDLLQLIPDFATALNKRDLDLALSRKICKSSLLKVTAMAAFRDGTNGTKFRHHINELEITDYDA